jgi:serine/threonine-protein kinase
MNGPGEGKDPALSSARDPLVGSVINGKFHIHRAIARGGMGRIYYATQAPLDRPVALKVVLTEGHNPEEVQNFLGRFLQEASILAKLQHPNVVTLFDYGKIESGAPLSGEMYFIAMEYLAGETLSARLKQRNFLATPEVLFLTRQIARGLREAHSRGVVHRDLKPSNIILVPEGDGGELVKIVDFGIGKVVAVQDVTKDLTQEGMMVGTPRYMAPEQFEGTASPASDIYALGTIAYQALAGSLPFHGATRPEFMVAKFAHAIPPIAHVNPEAYLPEALEALVLRMLARNPAERPALEDLFAQLSVCEQEVFGHAHGSGNTGPSAMRRTGQNLATSGSGSRPRMMEPSRVPPTMVQPVPQIPGGIPGLGYGTLGMTPRPMSTSMRPQPLPANGNGGARIGVVVALVLGLVGAGAIGIYAVKKSRTPTASAATSTTNDPPPAAAIVDPTFTLLIDSTPPGATVLEGDKTLGVTPLSLPIDRATVATAPRTFIVKKDGYVSANVVQGSPPPDEKQPKQMIALAVDAAPAKTTGTKSAGHPPAHGAGKPSGVRPGGGGDLDIRLNR